MAAPIAEGALPRAPSLSRRVRGLVEASHPFPIAMVVSLTILAGAASSRHSLDIVNLVLAGAAMLFSQLAIGWSNDYLDRNADARFQPEKPVPSGLVPAAMLLWLVPASLVLSAAAGLALGTGVFGWLIAGTACGFAYNLRLKNTHFSWVPYVAAFAILPPFVWAATDTYRSDFIWLYPIGASLAVAAHLANVLPDVEADIASGRRGIAARLGRPRALALLYACLVLPVALLGASARWLDYDVMALTATAAAYAALVAAALIAYRMRAPRHGAAVAFRLIAPAAVIFAVGWLAAV